MTRSQMIRLLKSKPVIECLDIIAYVHLAALRLELMLAGTDSALLARVEKVYEKGHDRGVEVTAL